MHRRRVGHGVRLLRLRVHGLELEAALRLGIDVHAGLLGGSAIWGRNTVRRNRLRVDRAARNANVRASTRDKETRMPSTILNSAVFRDIFTTPAMRTVFSDENRVQKYLDFEAALARAQGRLRIIPQGSGRGDRPPLRRQEHRHGQAQGGDRADRLSGAARRPAAGEAVQGRARRMVALGRHHPGHHRHRHRHADPRGARYPVEKDIDGISDALAALAKKYRDTPMAGRSNLQQAVPITFGYKMATMLAGFERHKQRLKELAPARAGRRIRRRRRHAVLARQGRAEGAGRADEGAQARPAGDFLAHRARLHRRGRLLPRARHRQLRQDRLRREAADADRGGRSLRAVPRRPRLVQHHAAEAQSDFVGLHHRADRHGEAAGRRAAGSA